MSVSARNVLNCLHHLQDNGDKFIFDIVEILCELNLIRLLTHLELESEESVLEEIIWTILPGDNLLRKWIFSIIFSESSEEFNVLVD